MRAELAETTLSTSRGNAAHPGVLRLAAIAVQLAWGIAAAALVFPFVSRGTRLSLRQRWARSMLDAIGVSLRVEGETIAPGALLVANHVSWLDILVLASCTPAVFVAKSEVRRWPAIGWLAARAETLFLRRSSGRSLLEVKNRVAELLLEGRAVAYFPEGTTSDGAGVLAFRSGLLQAAVDADRAVQPVAIGYCDGQGKYSAAAAFVDGTTLWQSIVAVCGSERICARIAVAPPLASAGRTRKVLARAARDAVEAIVAGRN